MTQQQCSTTTRQKALALAAKSDLWARGVARDYRGLTININLFASESEPGVVHLTRVDGAGCSCKGAQHSRSGICYHMAACQIVTERVRAAFAKPTDVLDDDPTLRFAF